MVEGAEIISLAAAVLVIAACNGSGPADAEWRTYNGHPDGGHYSRLQQVNESNVGQLREAWRMTWPEQGDPETNPLIIGRTLYGYTPSLNIVALDATTGRQQWRFDPGLQGTTMQPGVKFTGPDRGLAYWSDGHDRRLIAAVMNYLFAIDPDTGRPIESFGDHGAVDLRAGLRGDPAEHYVAMTSPAMIYRDLAIVGFHASEMRPAPPGDIRAFDVRTGKLRWAFHTIPREGEPGAETWPAKAWEYSGAANNWAGMALDEQRGILYAPTGSAVSDFYGADRLGNDLYANTLIALDAATGKRLWHYQTTHHDLWDRDLGSPPALVTVNRGGKAVDAVAQPSKQGFLFLFDRVTGEPLFPVHEQAFPGSDVPGESASPTQPVPESPAPFARQHLDESLLTERTPDAHAWALSQFRTFLGGDLYKPMSVDKPTIVFPGFDGGAEWGGAAVDPARGILYLNANDVAWTGGLVKTIKGGTLGAAIYQQQCSACHGPQRKGSPPAIPSLVGVVDRLGPERILAVIKSGRGRMPPFPRVNGYAQGMLLSFLQDGKGKDAPAVAGKPDRWKSMQAPMFSETVPTAYRFSGYVKFLDPDGYPAIKPPWGTLNAIDLNTGKYLWKIPLGYYPELASKGEVDTGTENYGGPMLTASGLLFIGATIYDSQFRAFRASDGSLLWKATLPYSGVSTPATYMVDGKQYVVIHVSNFRTPNRPQGGGYVAFALP